MSEHRWSLVVIGSLDEATARELMDVDAAERFDRVHELVDATRLEQVRGPVCAECRVSLRDVEAMAKAGRDWPCQPRPKALGGPLAPPEERLTRQQRRAKHRRESKVAKAS